MKLALALAVLTLLLAGCTQQSKDEYHQAGQSLTHAAKETGKAITTDVKSAAQTTKNAAATVKTKSQEHKAAGAKHGKG